MFDNDKIIRSRTTITICIGTNIHNVNIHSYTIKKVDQLDSSAINGPTDQNTVDYIGRQLETYWSRNWETGLSF